jgi:putative membrane protein
MKLILNWAMSALALLAVAYLVPSITIVSFWSALAAALVLGLVNAVLRPLFILLTLPVTLLTLGLFIFVINGLLFWFAGSLFSGFTVGGFWSGFFGAIVYSLISWTLASILAPPKAP